MLSEAELSTKLVIITTLERLAGESTEVTRGMKQDLLVDYTADELGRLAVSNPISQVVESVRTVALQQTAAAMELGLTQDMHDYHTVMRAADQRLQDAQLRGI